MRTGPLSRMAVVISAVVAATVSVPSMATAALTLQVTTTEDVVDAGDGELSLREAVVQAGGAGGTGHQIDVPAGEYLLDDGALLLLTFQPGAYGLTITGAGMGETVIDAQGLSRVLLVAEAGVTLEHLTVKGGQAPTDAPIGGGIYFQGGQTSLRLDHVRVTGNSAATATESSALGGGIGSPEFPASLPPSVEIVDSVIDDNEVIVQGAGTTSASAGGVYAQASSVTLTRTRIADNTVSAKVTSWHGAYLGPVTLVDTVSVTGNGPAASGPGGPAALGLLTGGDMVVRNVTVDSPAGGLSFLSTGGTATVEHTTIRAAGTALVRDSAPEQEVIVRNSVLDGAAAACEHAAGVPFASGGGNVASDASCGRLDAASDVVAANTGLGGVDATSTPVAVIPLAPGSPALDHGVPSDIAADARGVARPTAAPDAGAYEHRAPVAEDDVAATDQQTVVTIDVLANDLPGEVSLDAASVAVVTPPPSGAATALADGTVAFDPVLAGEQTFVYEVCQQGFTGQCDTASVAVAVAEAGPDLEAGVSRLAGTNRYETAAAVSRASFEPGIDVAFLATGADFPDALAGGPLAAALGAPILLSSASGLPEVTAEELARLRPGTVIALGGDAAVSVEVLADAADVAGGAVTDRHAGTNRFETAAAIARELAGADTVYLATGADFPDALAGGPVTDGAPILLASSGLPAATAEVLAELAPGRVVAMGGTGVVSEMTLTAAASAAGDGAATDRLSGTNRYETAVAIASLASSTDTVFVATGGNFPDALAAAPVAAAVGAAIVLTPPQELASATLAHLESTDPVRIVLLGGPGAVSDEVQSALKALVPDGG